MSLRTALVLVALGVALLTAPFAGVRATRNARTTADEPQYLLSAISLGEDASLDIGDERAQRRYAPFHEVTLPRQEATRADGSLVSPHDPLLPAILALPMRLGGWVAAKLTIAVLAGVLAALLVWIAVRRLAVPLGVATLGVATFALAPPLSIYATQVYPELPAALAVAVAIAALTGPLRRGGIVALVSAAVVLPWLSVKYVPVTVVLVALGLWRLARTGRCGVALGAVGALAAGGVLYALAHQAWYGGWTVYAAGDHFVGGETTVMGFSPNYPGRAVRLAGLLVDRGFGLVVWAPAFVLLVPALGALIRRRPEHWEVLAFALAAGWLTATFVALTMHGWWWPGRQVVVVLPAAVLAITWWAAQVAVARRLLVAGLVLGAASSLWLLVDGLAERITLVVDFEQTRLPVVQVLRPLLPDLRLRPPGTSLLLLVWIVALAAMAWWGWRSVAHTEPAHRERGTSWASQLA